jgi:diacylglycerol kinase (ATP)
MNLYKNPIIIFNPKSGGGRSKKRFEKCYKVLKKSNLFNKIDVFEANDKNTTINKVYEINKDKKNDLFITLGGDGSISTVCNGLMKMDFNERLPILPIPSGSGNSLLRDFDVKNIYDSLERFKKNNFTYVDVLLAESIENNFKWYCINILGLGFIANIAQYGEEKFNSFGSIKYILATIFALKLFTKYDAKIISDNNNKFESDAVHFISLSNSKYTGGKIMIAPEAKYNDGLMDVIVLHDLSRYRYMKGFAKVFSGKHIHEKGCLYFKTKEIKIWATPNFLLMPDGELEGNSPVKVKVLPGQIKFVL